MSPEKISSILKKNSKQLRTQFKVKKLFLFGSTARGTAAKGSDIDLLVEFDTQIGLFEFFDLTKFLSLILKHRVDLVTRDALHKWMIADIERDSIRVA